MKFVTLRGWSTFEEASQKDHIFADFSFNHMRPTNSWPHGARAY